MKIIHCGDIHLDSPFARLDSTEKKKLRRAELIQSFEKMVAYAAEIRASAIIIAGDLFDCSRISATAKNAVLYAVSQNPQIGFYYLRGNHDRNDFLSGETSLPSNLHLFKDEWTSYKLGENVYLTGAELTEDNSMSLYAALNLDVTHFNIVTLHGQDGSSLKKDDAEVINVNALKNKNIDYLALGHVHSFKCAPLDARAMLCYPGCLEARGFDETGEHGFVVLDVNSSERSCHVSKICRPIRQAHVVPVNISELMSSTEIISRVKAELARLSIPKSDMVKVELNGYVDFECEKNPVFIEQHLAGEYFDFKLKDLTEFKVDYDNYRLDESLKGEFIRTVEAALDISAEDKAEIIRIGIRALMGEEVE